MKYLYIGRHGDAERIYTAPSDFGRRLTPVGAERAACVAQILQKGTNFQRPERILSSNAPRAWRTAEIYANQWKLNVETQLTAFPSLYSGDQHTYLNTLVRSLPDEVDCAMIVGHNPTVSYLLATLLGSTPGTMQKGDVALVAFETVENGCNWENLYPETGNLIHFVIASSACEVMRKEGPK